MRPIRVTQTGVGNGAPMIVDRNGRPEISLQIVTTGTVTYTVQQTLDDLENSAITPTWFVHPDANLVAATSSQQGNYAYVPAAVRIAVTAGTGSATLTVLQAGTHG